MAATRLTRQPSGFTLVELMISTAVILMILTVSLPAFTAFQRRQSLLNAGQLLRDAILETHNYALAPRAGENGQPGKESGADRYRILFIHAASPGYVIEEQQSAVSQPWKTLKRGYLPRDIQFCDLSAETIYTTEDPVGIGQSAKGLIYSISGFGKIVGPQTSGNITLTLKQVSLAERARVTINIDTGRVDVTVEPSGTGAGGCRL